MDERGLAKSKIVICPYCGDMQPAADRCRACLGLFEPLSRQATHNEMGPWFIRDPRRPFRPGCSYETLIKLIERGQLTKNSIIRGPTTKQFWSVAKRTPGVAHLFGYCHNCDASVDPADHGCHACGVPFGAYLDRNYLGLPEVRPLPWDAEYGEPGERDRFGRVPEWPRPEGAAGLSSFASDAELLGGAEHPAAGTSPIVPGAASVRATTAAPPPAPVDPVLAGYDAEVATRAFERRIAEQQRTIRMLAIVLVAIIVATIVTGAVVLAIGTQGNAGGEAVADAAAAPVESRADASTPAAERSAHEEAMSESDQSIAPAPPASEEQPNEQPDEALNSLARARALIEQAEDASRPREDRLADLAEAITILEQLAAAPSDEQLEGVDDALEHARRAHERITLEEFFP